MAYPALPHFAFPFARTPDGTGIQVNEQDTEAEIMACEMVIVSCPVGFREDRPEFGWTWPELVQAPISSAELAQALKQFESRAPVRINEVHDYVSSTVTFNIDVFIQSDSEAT
jgi:phage baseplate assembly protein W